MTKEIEENLEQMDLDKYDEEDGTHKHVGLINYRWIGIYQRVR